MRNKNQNLIVIALFCIYPVLALPIVCLEIFNRKSYAFFLLAAFYGLVGFFYPPVGDYYRYYLDFEDLKTLNIHAFLQELSSEFDYMMPSILWLTGRINLGASYTRFFSNFLCYCIFFTTFQDVVRGNNNKRQVFLFFIILNLLLGFRFGLVRFGLGTALIVLGIYKSIFKNDIVQGLLIAFISVLTHVSLAPCFLLLVVSLILKYNGNKVLSIILIVASLLASSDFLTPLLNMLPIDASLINHASYYIDGYYAADYYLDHSLRFRISFLLGRSSVFLLLVFYFFYFKKSKVSGFLNFMFVLLFITGPFQGIHSRYETVTCFLLLFWCFVRFPQLKYDICRKNVKILLYLSIFLFFIGVYSARRELSISKEYKLFYPTLFITHEPYPDSWINSHVDFDGSPIVDF